MTSISLGYKNVNKEGVYSAKLQLIARNRNRLEQVWQFSRRFKRRVLGVETLHSFDRPSDNAKIGRRNQIFKEKCNKPKCSSLDLHQFYLIDRQGLNEGKG